MDLSSNGLDIFLPDPDSDARRIIHWIAVYIGMNLAKGVCGCGFMKGVRCLR